MMYIIWSIKIIRNHWVSETEENIPYLIVGTTPADGLAVYSQQWKQFRSVLSTFSWYRWFYECFVDIRTSFRMASGTPRDIEDTFCSIECNIKLHLFTRTVTNYYNSRSDCVNLPGRLVNENIVFITSKTINVVWVICFVIVKRHYMYNVGTLMISYCCNHSHFICLSPKASAITR